MTYDIKCLPLIYLGRQGENLARAVEIDVGAMLDAYPGASIGLVFQRAGETELYIGATTLGGTVLSWPISAAVTANAGRGKIEVRAMLGDVLAKSVTAPTQVDVSLSGAGSTPPDPEEDWIDDVLQAASEAKQSAASAADSAQQAEQAVEDAKDAAAAVEAAKAEAVQAVQEAGQAAQEAVSAEGAEAVQAIGQAASGAVEQVQQAGAAQVQAIEQAGNDKIQEINTANAHAPQINADTGKWQTWDAASGTYVDTEANAEGPQGPKGEKGDTGSQGPQGVSGTAATITVGSVTESAPGGDASVTNSGTASAAVLDFVIPRGETGPTGATGATGPAGLGVPQPTADDAGKIPVVNASGTGYELGTPAPDVDDTLSIPGAPADAAAVGEAIEAISPEDESVGAKPWTSKHIVDMLCPPLEVSGNPVQCYPVAGYPLGVQASWEPKQEGEGDPSPENIRPIVGLDSVSVTRCGSNMFDFGKVVFSQSEVDSGIVSVDYAQKTITIAAYTNNVGYTQSLRDVVGNVPAGTYVLDAETSSVNAQKKIYFLDSAKTVTFGTPTLLTDEDLDSRFSWYNNIANPEPNTISNTRFSVAETDYAPYTGTTATLALPETIYGGTVDAVTGEGVQEWAHIESYNREALPGEWISDRDVYAPDATPTIGAEIAYKLAAPTPFQATGGQPLPALPGTNTVYTDADAVRVEGRTDPLATVQALTARIAALKAAAEQQAQVNAALTTLGVDTTPDQITALRMLGVETEE